MADRWRGRPKAKARADDPLASFADHRALSFSLKRKPKPSAQGRGNGQINSTTITARPS